MDSFPRPIALFSRSVLALIASVITGLLIAGLLLPLVGGAGLVARAGASVFESPVVLEEPRLAQRTRILAADGSVLAEVTDGEDRIKTTLKDIPLTMQHALLAIEDDGFYEHAGLDLKGVIRALWKNHQAGEVKQGASTLTQQYIKNALLLGAKTDEERAAAVETTTRRKLHEARLALNYERTHTKAKILENYFNIAYFGNGVYGVATAAEFYFSKRVDQLLLHESAMLAGLVKNPGGYDPIRRPKVAKNRRDLVLSRMAAVYPCPGTNPHITKCYSQSARSAAKRKLDLNIRRRPRGINSIAPQFVDYVQDYLLNDSKLLGKTRAERHNKFFRGGLTITTTIDPKVQRATQRALESADFKDKQPHTAMAVVEPGTGAIRGMADNLTAKKTLGINLATGGKSGMQAGSTFKVFVLAAAIEQGIPLKTSIRSPQQYTSEILRDGPKPYTVGNAGGEACGGSCTLITGTHNSANTFFLQLAERTGIKRPVELARAMMGRHPSMPLNQKWWQANPSFIFGTPATSVLDVANAYATIAARGMACTVNPIAEIRFANGRKVKPEADCRRALSEKVADTLTYILPGVITQGTGTRANIGRPAAGKTGSANDNTSAFFAGFTPQYSAAVWMGNSKAPIKHPLVGGISGPGGLWFQKVYGGTFPAIIWQRAMSRIHEGLPVEQFPPPPADMWKGSFVRVPNVAGLTVAQARDALKAVGLVGHVIEGRFRSEYAEGRVARSNPPAGASMGIGSSVALYISNGVPPDPDPTEPPPGGGGGNGKKKPPPPPPPEPTGMTKS